MESNTEKAFQLGSNEGPAASTDVSIGLPTNQPLTAEERRKFFFDYLQVEAKHQLPRLQALGINTEDQFFEQAINTAIYIAENLTIETAALKRENEELRKSLADHKIANFWDHFQAEHKEKVEAEQLNEKLMGLLETQFKIAAANSFAEESSDLHYIHYMTESDWQSFCKEHGLTTAPPTSRV